MEEEGWLRRVLDASRLAVERLRASGPDADDQLIADLEAFALRIQRRLDELRGDLES